MHGFSFQGGSFSFDSYFIWFLISFSSTLLLHRFLSHSTNHNFFASLFTPSWMNLLPYFFIFQELKKWVKVLSSVCRIWHRKIILLSLFFYNASSTCSLPNSTTSSIYTTSNKWYLSNFFICSSHYFIFMKWFGDLNSNF
jgi:hypothetical protein